MRKKLGEQVETPTLFVFKTLQSFILNLNFAWWLTKWKRLERKNIFQYTVRRANLSAQHFTCWKSTVTVENTAFFSLVLQMWICCLDSNILLLCHIQHSYRTRIVLKWALKLQLLLRARPVGISVNSSHG